VYGVGLTIFQTMVSGRPEERYLITPGLLVIVALAALLQPSRTLASRVPFGVFAVLLAVVIAVNYQDPTSIRTGGPAWSDGLRQAVAVCKADPQRRFANVTAVLGSVRIPCTKLR
jgi:hypothetical protein